MFRTFVNAIIFVFAVIALAAVMLESNYADVVRFNGVRHVVATWSEWTEAGWMTLSDLIGMKIIAVFRRALALLILFVSLYISAGGRERRMEFVQSPSLGVMLSFVVAFSVVIAITFNDVLFSRTITPERILQAFAGILTTAISLAYALPAQPHLPKMTKGLWIAIAIWTACVV